MLFAGVLAWRLLSTSAEHYSVFYVLPVALAATAFGLRGGVVSSLLACALVVVGIMNRDQDLTFAGWTTRMVPLLLLGVLLGRATDRAREAESERRHLELAAVLHREAIEINDSLVQRMTAAKWALESGQTEAGLQALTRAVSEGQRLVSDLIRRAEMGGRTNHVPGVTDGRISATQQEDAGSDAV
jgi:glucose-6-phosphate-specific signal transduction histidine kinase